MLLESFQSRLSKLNHISDKTRCYCLSNKLLGSHLLSDEINSVGSLLQHLLVELQAFLVDGAVLGNTNIKIIFS